MSTPRSSRLSLFTLVLLSSTTAGAESLEGLGVGARVEQGRGGVGIDYWRGRVGASFLVNASLSSAEYELRDPQGIAGDADNYRMVALSAGAFTALARTDRTRLALGLRLAYHHVWGTFGDVPGEFSDRTLYIELPLRLQWAVTDHLAVHTEVGLAVGAGSSHSDVINGPDVVGESSSSVEFITAFGSPLSNLGMTYFF